MFGSGEAFEFGHGPGRGFPDFGPGVLWLPGADPNVGLAGRVHRHGLSRTGVPEAEVPRFPGVEIAGAEARAPGFVEADPQVCFLCSVAAGFADPVIEDPGFVAVGSSVDPEFDALDLVVAGSAGPGPGAPETAVVGSVVVEPMVPWIGDFGSVAI